MIKGIFWNIRGMNNDGVMDRYEEVILERNDNRCSRIEINVLVTNGGISSGKG
jgi:hypothetical protein